MEILADKAYKNTEYISRYSPFPYYYHTLDNKYVYGTDAYLKNTTVYKIHTITETDTLDNLALRYYNNPTLYWVICSFNRIQDPFEPLIPGETLKIPSISNIEFNI